MVDQAQNPTMMQKVAGRFLQFSLSHQGYNGAFNGPSMYQRCTAYGNYSNTAFQYPLVRSCGASTDPSIVPYTTSPVFGQALSGKGLAHYSIDFLLGGVLAAGLKTTLAPYERLKRNTANVIRYFPTRA
ncbi:hypothetical protein Patl1_17219 [Pistacia atlantica]|uniref:Uncharacterized protein n=1 Tax=Pistacia atlantica TaxID=434234 RepID=A0ACC1B7W6_9ROSI|nr:hypothetical protein Patl1_17219 [Pistacia atlantica]